MADNITVILTAYRRPASLARQVEAIRRQTAPVREVWAWANEPDQTMMNELERAQLDRVVVSSKNAFVHARFSLALLAPTEFVAIFDDDTIPGEQWLENCLETFEKTPGILGSAGVRLHDETYSSRSIHGWHAPSDQPVEVDLVGHAWFLKTSWVPHLFSAPPLTGTNGEDIELCARALRNAGIRSYCPPHPPGNRRRWGSLDGLELGSDQLALSRRPNHLAERDRIVKAEIDAGWKPYFRRTNGAVGPSPAAPFNQPRLATLASDETPLERNAEGNGRLLLIGFDAHERLRAMSSGTFKEFRFVELDRTIRERPDFEPNADFPSDLEDPAWDSVAETFDSIVCDRAIEHCREPLRLLQRLRRLLSPNGRLSLRFANVRRHELVHALIRGSWAGGNGARPDRRPIQFFTRREVEKLLFRAGFQTCSISIVPGPEHEQWQSQGRSAEVHQGSVHTNRNGSEDAEEFYVHEYLIEASPAQELDAGLTSIVIATHNQLSFTRECLDSIKRFTDEPYEIIVVDNASTDGTVEYLNERGDVRVIQNSENHGFPAAANQGIREASGMQILLLNNDTIVTTGWLRRMIRALRSNPAIGLVGPCSNQVSGMQKVMVHYESRTDLDAVAWLLGKEYDAARESTDRLVGFCLLVSRGVVDKIGLLDERFGMGCYEDDDYTLRALKAGFQAVIAADAFVHHFGSATFMASEIDFGGLMRENEQIFRKKWELPQRDNASANNSNDSQDESPLVDIAPGGGLLLKRRPIVLSLCMIVRNSSKTLGACLESIRPWVDEMIVVDTGSTDDTPELAASFGARVFHYPWPDSFSIARNESVRHARGKWILWMDSDDTITPDCGRGVRELAYKEHDPSHLAFLMQVHCPGGEGELSVVDHVKMFRNHPEIRFENRIHEQIIPSVRRLGGEVVWTDLYVVHSGSDQSPEAQARKRERDLYLLRLEEKERPNHPFTLFNLGMTYSDGGENAKAEPYLLRCIEHSRHGEAHIRKAYAILASSLTMLRRMLEAEEACRKGLELYPLDDELRFRMAIVLHEKGSLAEATSFYEDILERHEERHLTSVCVGIRGEMSRRNLAVIYKDMGKYRDAERQWRAILAENPNHKVALQGLEELKQARRKLSMD